MVSDPETELTVLTVSIGFATMGGKNKELLHKLEEARSMFHSTKWPPKTLRWWSGIQHTPMAAAPTPRSNGIHGWNITATVSFVTYVILMNRGDCCGDRLSPYEISVDGKVCGGKQRRIGQGATSLLWCGLEGTRVRISLPRKGILTLCGLEILGTRLWECGNLRRGRSRPRARQMLAGGFLWLVSCKLEAVSLCRQLATAIIIYHLTDVLR